ncbi:hypothetical protein [Bradyrhizobium sp. S3.2.12]|uniref:hypothetical protein n=1 Tax=Bradyrhizobium sp. S3.2.12 TaxID=3156387 RepID=UPI003399DE61
MRIQFFHAYLWEIEPPSGDLLKRKPTANMQICYRDTMLDAVQPPSDPAVLPPHEYSPQMVALALSAGGMSLAALLTRPWWAALVYVALSQFLLSVGQGIYNVQQVPIRYALAPHRMQGRVNASIRSVVWGLAPLGALVGGAAGAASGLRATLLASSVLGATSVLWIWRSPLRHTHSLCL